MPLFVQSFGKQSTIFVSFSFFCEIDVIDHDSVRSILEGLFKLSVFFKFSYLVAKMGVGHQHGDTYLYHILVTKIRPPRVTGYMPPSGHWRFRGMTGSKRSGLFRVAPSSRENASGLMAACTP